MRSPPPGHVRCWCRTNRTRLLRRGSRPWQTKLQAGQMAGPTRPRQIDPITCRKRRPRPTAHLGRHFLEGTNMHPPAANKASPVLEGAAYKAVFSKIDWRLIPLLLIAYMVAYLDRINIGYAQLQ